MVSRITTVYFLLLVKQLCQIFIDVRKEINLLVKK